MPWKCSVGKTHAKGLLDHCHYLHGLMHAESKKPGGNKYSIAGADGAWNVDGETAGCLDPPAEDFRTGAVPCGVSPPNASRNLRSAVAAVTDGPSFRVWTGHGCFPRCRWCRAAVMKAGVLGNYGRSCPEMPKAPAPHKRNRGWLKLVLQLYQAAASSS